MGFYLHDDTTNSQQTETEAEPAIVRFVRILPLLWLLGSAVLAVYVGACNFHLWWLVTRERPLTDQKILDLLEDCKSEMGIRNILGIVTTDKVKSAALFGFIRPRLLLPAGMIETLSLKELRFVFLHELGHLRRRDIYIGWLMSLLQVLHWFNPLVWLAFYRMQSDRELACDALVLTHTRRGESKDYGRTIVNLLERFSRPQRLPSMAGILETKSQLKRRIKMIAKFKKTSRPRWAGAMLLLAVLACVVLTNAYVAKADFTFGIPTNLGPTVNSSANDAVPSISADGLELYFGSDRFGEPYNLDIWVSRRTTVSSDWGQPENIGPPVNGPQSDHWPRLSADGLELYFYSVDRPGGYGIGDIWLTTRATAEAPWGEPVNLGPSINSSEDDGAAFISTDGLELYFTSRRSGNYNLYVSKRADKNDKWNEPLSLDILNSPDGESGTSLSADGLTLFFHSDRPGGFGDWDFYVTTRETRNTNWSPPVNLGPTINTHYGDMCASLSFDGHTLYFCDYPLTDVRPGGIGGGDLWQVSLLPVVDFNGDGKVDFKDFRKLAQYWGQNEPSCDIAPLPNGDGIVDEKDLNLLAEYLLKEFQPVAHWKLDEAEGNIAEDSIGINDGALNGNPVWQPVGGTVGGALQIDGIDDYVSTAFSLDPTKGSFSAFAWIKGGEPGQVIICQTGGTDLDTRWLWADPSYGRLMTWLMHPTYDPLVSESVITDGQWHHVGLVYDLDSFCRHLYVDGAEVAKDNSVVGGEPSDGGLYFGADKMLGQETFFYGLIDDVRIYDEVLSAEEVVELAR
jgi:beta-lactamase regulating signal transducer with metallopeptidase domain/Tol biopolymer transport system component